ncbi:MAG: rod shape-determining protein MreC [Rubricoccaceae bacterium]
MALPQQLWERSREAIVFGVLFATALGIYVSRNGEALSRARSASLAITAPIEGLYARAGQFRRSLGENERLRAETVELATEVARLREARTENATLRALVGFADSLDTPRVMARVVAKDITQQANLLTINAGSSDAIEAGMPVINEQGIVGKVITVSRNYAVVMPHQNTQFAVPATVDELNRNGVVRWDGEQFDRLLMEYVVKTEPVTRGMLIRTSPFSGVFPAGMPIGRVDTAFAAQGRNDYVIYLTPSAPIGEVGYVYVLLARPDPEQAILEAAARDTLGVDPTVPEATAQ